MPNPFDVPTPSAPTGQNPFDVTPSAQSGGNPFDVASPAAKGTNPFDVAGGTASDSSAPAFARTPTDNWAVNALRASNRFTKHLATGGGFGVPDQAGEDADDAKLNSVFDQSAGVEQANQAAFGGSALGSMMAPMTPNMHGLGPAALRTGLDAGWLVPGEWYGKAAGLFGKGLGMGVDAAHSRVLNPLFQRAPAAVQDAVRGSSDAVADVARGITHGWQDLNRWGGNIARKIGPETYRDATLASNRTAAGDAELARRLEVQTAAIRQGLTDTQWHDVLRVAKGEIDVASDPEVNAAARKFRSLQNDKFYLQGNASGRARVALGSPTVANKGLSDVSHVAPPKVTTVPDAFEKAVPDDLWGAGMPKHPDLPANSPGRFTLRGGEAGINRTAAPFQKTYQLPENLREFAPPDEQGVLGAENYKKNQVPGMHAPPTPAEAAALAKERPLPYNRLFPAAPQALHQKPFTIGPALLDASGKPQISAFDEAIAGSNKATAKQAAAAQLRHELGVEPNTALDPLGKPEDDTPSDALRRLFEETPEAKGAARTPAEKVAGAMRVPADAARNALTALGLKHGLINVPTLAVLSAGSKAGEMFVDAAKALKMSPEKKWEAQRAAREAGVLGPEVERKNPILDLIGKVPNPVRATLGAGYGAYRGEDAENQANPDGNTLERIGAGLAGAALGGLGGRHLPFLAGKANDLTWALDHAAKSRVLDANLAKGMEPGEAAMGALHDTIDYAHQTPIAKWLRHWGLAPFATFATKVPGAVLGSVARDPRKAMLLDRLSGGLATEGTIDRPDQPLNRSGKPAQFVMSNPLSETLGLAKGPSGYLRTKASDTAKVLADGIAALLTHGGSGSNYMTGGMPLLPHQNKLGENRSGFLANAAMQDLPLGKGREILDAVGADEYTPEDLVSQILGPTIGGYTR